MASTLELALLALALILNGLLAGASLDKAITQVPARRTIGLRAMAEYHRATDLGPGLFLYPILDLGAPCSHGPRRSLSSKEEMSPQVPFFGLPWERSYRSATSSRPRWRPRTSFA